MFPLKNTYNVYYIWFYPLPYYNQNPHRFKLIVNFFQSGGWFPNFTFFTFWFSSVAPPLHTPTYTHKFQHFPQLIPHSTPLFPHYLTPFPHPLSFLLTFFTLFHHIPYPYLYFPHHYFYIYNFPLNCLCSIWRIKSCLHCVIIKFNSFGKICVAD